MSWKKVKLGDILTESKVISENPNPDRRITVRLKVLGVEKRGLENEVEGATKQYIRKAGQFIYGKQNFHKGAFGIVPIELDGFESSSDLPAFDVDKSCLPEFIFYFFKQGNFYLELSKIASGVATQRINTSQLFELELLLPDIKSQKQLIANIQSLEKNGSEISNEFTYQLSLVKKLRQQLLQDAVEGKLVEQNKKDEPASELLKKIKAEKQKLIVEKKLKKEKELPPIKPEEIPFEIPENWVWCRLGDLIDLTSGQDLAPYEYSDSYSSGMPYITGASNLQNGEVIINRWTNNPKSFAINGDLLLTCKGSGIGKMAYLKIDKVHIARQIMAVRSPFISIKYIEIILSNNIKTFRLNAKSLIPGIDRPQVFKLLVPLPPLLEQNRIVQKLDELMQYCNELEARIKESESQNEKLLQQVLREALRKEPVGA